MTPEKLDATRRDGNSHVAHWDVEPARGISVDARHGTGYAGADVLERRADECTAVSIEATGA